MLMHAEWGGRPLIEGAAVLDVFAGTGALGLEALSRGAAAACFIESDRTALRALRTNVAACKAEDRTEVLPIDVLSSSAPSVHGYEKWNRLLSKARDDRGNGGTPTPASLVFLDPPYGRNLVPRAIKRLRESGRIRRDALVVAETGSDETWTPDQPLLAERRHGAARIMVFRAA